MKIIGLTGGIGSGKTSVARLLAARGAAIVNADIIGHDVYSPGTPGWSAVRAEFGDAILAADNTIDRARLGAIVFADPKALRRLNEIVHPLILAEAQRQIAAFLTSSAPAIVLEAALLVEASWTAGLDQIWLVVAPPDAVRQRLVRDRNMTPEQIEARVQAQISDAVRRQRADVVIENDGTLATLEERVERAWNAALA